MEAPSLFSFRDIAPYVRATPEKEEAYKLMNAALRSGELVRQPCERCGGTDRIHGHHPNYAKPLDVIWLCAFHHAEWHRENGLGLNGGDEPMRAPGGHELTGQRFGALVVVRKIRSRRGYRWLCDCDCGKKVTRDSGYLVFAASNGVRSCCRDCKWDRFLAKQRHQGRRYAELRAFTGELYTAFGLEKCVVDIREQCGRELGCLPELSELDGIGSLVSPGLDYWMTGDGETSDDDRKDGATLEELGQQMGITRERVRQLEERAMANLQRRVRAFLNPLRSPTTGKILPPPPPVRRSLDSERKKKQKRRRSTQKVAA